MAEEKKKPNQAAVGCLAIALIGAFVLYNRCTRDKPQPAAAAETRTPEQIAADKANYARYRGDAPAAAAATSTVATSCSISIPKLDSKVLVFPTEESYDEFGKASASKDAAAINFAAMQGFWVARGTKCLWLKRGLLTARVRVLEGPHAGKLAWLDREWSEGRE